MLNKLVQIRNIQAYFFGYDNYLDYVYKTIYNRDYTVEDAEKLQGYVKKYMKESYLQTAPYAVRGTSGLSTKEEKASDIVSRVEPCILSINKELEPAYTYMEENRLFSLTGNEKRMDTRLTMDLYHFGAPIIFMKLNGTAEDTRNFVHEFGHFNAKYHSNKCLFKEVREIDKDEINALALELLSLEYSNELYGVEAKYIEMLTYSEIIQSAVLGAVVNEFEQELYSSERAYTSAELDEIFGNIAKEYGMDAEAYCGLWACIPQLYETPGLSISYTTSAVASLAIGMDAKGNMDKGVDEYMKTTQPNTLGFREFLSNAGVKDIFVEENVKEILKQVYVVVNELRKEVPIKFSEEKDIFDNLADGVEISFEKESDSEE